MTRLIKACLLSGLMLLFLSQNISAQRAIDFLQMQGNSEELFLRIISESDAVSAGNGVMKIQLPDGSSGAADLVPTSDPDASELRIQTPYGTRAWREESFYGKAYGGAVYDRFYGITGSTDGGLAIGGYTSSFGNGSNDFQIIKTDEDGSLNWAYAMGFAQTGVCYEILSTSTGGYLLSGYIQTPSYIDKAYIYHLNSSGSVIIAGQYGNPSYGQRFYGAVQTSDNNFVALGASNTPTNNWDIYINKINQANGGSIWSYEIGTSETEFGHAITLRPDGGFVGVGNVSTPSNGHDMYMLMISSSGSEELSFAFGGTGTEVANDVATTYDGKYVLAGYTNSSGAGGNDFYITKRDIAGNEIWSAILGGASSEVAYGIIESNDHGYLVAGSTLSYGAGNNDLWLVKLDIFGTPLWSWAFGGTSYDVAEDLYQDVNGCIYVCGYTGSYGEGSAEGLLVKFSPDGKTCLGMEVTPGSDNIDMGDFSATRIDHFDVDRTPLPMKKIDAHCIPMKQDLQQPNPSNRGEISITPTVTTICN